MSPKSKPTPEKMEEETTQALSYEELSEELEKAKTQSAEYFDALQRERADFTNYRNRVLRDQDATRQDQKRDIVKKFLILLDDLERAIKNKPEKGEGAEWAKGIELIYRKFLSILNQAGIEQIEAENCEFDPNCHEALTHEPSKNHESGHVIEVIEHGYKLGDRIIRPARVRVAK